MIVDLFILGMMIHLKRKPTSNLQALHLEKQDQESYQKEQEK